MRDEGIDYEKYGQRVPVPPEKPFFTTLKSNLVEIFFPDDPFRLFKKHPAAGRRFLLGLQYLVPFLEWVPRYSFEFFKSDLIAGITIASLAVPQGISYANLASLPPIIGLYSSFVPPLIYAMLGSSRDVAVGTIAVASLLIPSMLGKEINPVDHQEEYISLVFTATFFSGVLQAALGFLRLGFIVDLLSHATIVGFMGGAATIVCLQQLKGMLGLVHFTHHTDIISVMHAVFSQTHKWRWESALLGCCFLSFLLLTRYYSKRKGAFFWINAIAPLTSVILGSLLVYFTHAEKHGVQVIGHLKRGLNPLSLDKLAFRSPHLMMAFKIGAITGIIVLAEGVAVGRSFAVFKNYHIDGNKEMIAFGLMNIVGSFTSCYLTSGPFSRTAVNFNAGCRTAVSNIVMSMAVMITLLLLTPFFYYTPLVVLAAIIISAMVGLINYEAAFHLFKVDKFDFIICIGAYLGVVFGSIEIGLVNAVTLSLIRLLLVLARPKTVTLGNIPNTMTYSNTEQYPLAERVRGVLILQINSSIYFTSENYLRERILRWVYEEEERIRSSGETSLQYLILDMGAVASIDTSGIRMLEEVKRTMDMKDLKVTLDRPQNIKSPKLIRRAEVIKEPIYIAWVIFLMPQLALANPGSEVMKKLYKSNFIEAIGQDWIYPTVAEAADACSFALPTSKRNSMGEDRTTQQENV